MKANELMIGDWVMHQDKPLYIAGIYGGRVYDEDNNVYRIDKITPIPLTPEILEKNGFDYNEYNGLYSLKELGDRSYVKESASKNWYISIELRLLLLQIFCKYVHELQHALRLCGLNELADNFKV